MAKNLAKTDCPKSSSNQEDVGEGKRDLVGEVREADPSDTPSSSGLLKKKEVTNRRRAKEEDLTE